MSDFTLEKKLPNGITVKGRLEHDCDCENPCTSCDGVGMIWSFNTRHINFKHPDDLACVVEQDDDAVLLSYFEHGSCLWDVAGGDRISGCPDMQWDGCRFAGVWIPDDSVRESYNGQDGKTRREWMVEQAESACRQYTYWANGECYGYCVKWYDDNGKEIDRDSCYGFVGRDCAEEELESTFNYMVKRLTELPPLDQSGEH